MRFKQRVVKIKNYRNIAVNQDSDFELILNYYFDEGEKESADLVLLIGPNNVGKSNILHSLLFWNENISFNQDADVTYYTFGKDKHYPEIKFVHRYHLNDNDSHCITYTKSIKNKDTQAFNLERPDNFTRKELTSEEKQLVIALAKAMNGIINTSSYYNNQPSSLHTQFPRTDLNSCIRGDLTNIKYDFIESIYVYLKNAKRLPTPYNTYKEDHIDCLLYGIKKKLKYTQKFYDDLLEEKWNIKLRPYVVNYETKTITSKDLKILIKDIDNIATKCPILNKLFNYIDYDVSNIKDCISGVSEDVADFELEKIRDEIAKKLEPVNDIFNSLFPLQGESKYSIGISIKSTQISLTISKDSSLLVLERQSTGFQWFFDFFFNLYLDSKLEAGDIVLMDEPCSPLHEEGVKEFYKFLKDFIKSSGITFVVVTHRASFINVDYLEEVRQIEYKDGITKVENKFNAVPLQDSDVLKPILDSLLSKRNTIFDNRTSVPIFVEGITDYCYLTGYKQIYQSDKDIDLIFLPVEGLRTKNHVEVLKKIHNIELASILLVDGDQVGLNTQKESLNYKNIKTIALSDIGFSKQVKYIEDLFSDEDRRKYCLGGPRPNDRNPRKHFDSGLLVKKMFLKENGISEETKSNFKLVFDYIYKFLDENEIGIVPKKTFDSDLEQANINDIS